MTPFTKIRVPVFTSLGIMVFTVASIFIIGSSFYEFESSCEVVDDKKVCTTKQAWKGTSLPVLSGFLGTAINIYFAIKSGKPIEQSLPPSE